MGHRGYLASEGGPIDLHDSADLRATDPYRDQARCGDGELKHYRSWAGGRAPLQLVPLNA